MSDNQTNLPPGCAPVDNPPGSGSFNVMPSTAGDTVQNPAKASEAPATPSEQPATPDATGQVSAQDQALELVTSYNDAVTRRYHSSRVVEQQAAIREIAALRQKKQEILKSLAKSGLSFDERRAVRKTLDGIPSR